MKQQIIKKRIIRESAVIGAALAVLAGLAWYSGSLSDDYEREAASAANGLSMVTSQMSSLHEKYAKVEKYTSLYEEATQKNAQAGLSINRQMIKDKFDEYKNSYHLANLHLSMAPVEKMDNPKYKRASNVIESSQITVTLEAMLDEDIYGLLDALRTQLPGAVKVTRLTLTRGNPLNDSALQTISQQGSTGLIRGELDFTWFGIQPVTPGGKADGSGKSS